MRQLVPPLTVLVAFTACGPQDDPQSSTGQDTAPDGAVARPPTEASPPGDSAPPTDSTPPGAEPASEKSCETDPPAGDPDRVVAVYFNCEGGPPGALLPVYRRLDEAESDDEARLGTAMRALVAGPNREERQRGFDSFFSEDPGIEVLGTALNHAGDSARVDFTSFEGRLPERPGVKSFVPPGVMAELTWTLFKSFPELQAARFSFEGNEEAFWAWVGGPPQVFTREDWGRI